MTRTRKDHRGRYTFGSVPEPRESGVPLFTRPAKSAPHVKAEATKRADTRARVLAKAAEMRRELGL